MIPDEKALEDYMHAAANFLDLEIDEAFRPGVLDNLRILRRYAQLVNTFALDEATEASPIFIP